MAGSATPIRGNIWGSGENGRSSGAGVMPNWFGVKKLCVEYGSCCAWGLGRNDERSISRWQGWQMVQQAAEGAVLTTAMILCGGRGRSCIECDTRDTGRAANFCPGQSCRRSDPMRNDRRNCSKNHRGQRDPCDLPSQISGHSHVMI